MNFFEIVKDYFSSSRCAKFANPVEDAKVLSAIAKESIYLKASNGVQYYYYFPQDKKNIYIAKYLMVRNGVKVKVHNSKYYYVKHKALRIPRSKLERNSRIKNFVESINICNNAMTKAMIESKLKAICCQMNGNVK